MKGMTYYYLYSRKAKSYVEVPPDIFYTQMGAYWNITIEYENGDVWFSGDTTFEDGVEIGRIAIYNEEEENDKEPGQCTCGNDNGQSDPRNDN